ncbi:MAG: SDR family oxidoreductase [Phycisphaerales bacterium]|nr:SDR family oxidoreductase [Phycisphaerales bacterium]
MTQARPIAIVTGGTRRVGLAIGRALARSGLDLVLTYRSDEGEAAEAKRELEAAGASVRLERLVLDDLAAAAEWAERLAGDLPRADVLIHNASSYDRTPLPGLSPAELMNAYAVNAAGPALISRALAPRLAGSTLAGGGAVVAMADMHVMGRPRKELLAYSMSKAALVEMVRSLARELAPKVRVNAVAPGVVAWPESGPEADEGERAAYLRRVPLARPGTPEDAAETVRWLALEAKYTTGEIIRVDGGRWLS